MLRQNHPLVQVLHRVLGRPPLLDRSYLRIGLGLVFLILSIIGFWYVEPTTPARIGSLAFVVLVSFYSFFTKRVDIPASCALFFLIYGINQYLFSTVLPIWMGLILLIIAVFFLWLVVYGGKSIALALLSLVLLVELMQAFQYINSDLKFQALLVALPFILLGQHQFFTHLKQ